MKKSPNIKDLLPLLEDILSLLTEAQRLSLTKVATVHSFRKNELLYSSGQHPEYLYCLVSGKVKICREGVGLRTQIVRVIRAVEYFGYRPAFAGEDFLMSATAFEPVVTVCFPIDVVVAMTKENASLAWFFIRKLAVDLGHADERTVTLTQKHIRGRLADALLFLKRHYGVEEDGYTLSLSLSREDLANLSNMTTANAIRTLSAFASERLVAVDGRKIKLLDEARLLKISRMG